MPRMYLSDPRVDLGKRLLKGSKKPKGRNREKTNLNHLLNFTLPAREPPPLPPLARSRRSAENTVSERQAEINRSVFINANFRFVLKLRHWTTFARIAVRPDMQLRSEWIERVIVPVTGDMYDTSIADKSIVAKLGPGSHITMRLMKRLRGTTFCLPRASTSFLYSADMISRVKKAIDSNSSDADPRFNGCDLPWTFSDGALTFAKFMLASRTFCISEYQRELGELQQASSDEGADTESRLFIESAIMSVESALADAQNPSAEERKLEDLASVGQNFNPAHIGGTENTAQAAEDGTISHGSVTEERMSAERRDDVECDDFFYFYQADDGQHIYIHPLHMRIMAHDRGNYAVMPDTLDIKLKYSIDSVVTDEVRRRFRFLDHLPLRCEVIIIEPDVSALVSHKSLDKFRQQLSHHDKQHAARARSIALEEARSDIAAAAAQNAMDISYGDFSESLHWSGTVNDDDNEDSRWGAIESDAGNFPALGDNTPAEASAPPESGTNGRSNVLSPPKPESLWPRQPLPSEFSNNSAHSGLWDEFEKAAAMHGSHHKANDHDMGDASHYEEGHSNDPFDFSIPTKDSKPQSGKSKRSKQRNGKKGIKLVLSGASTRRSR
ncbi:hypothetical protein H4R20_000882 [Coemansia guatemalensis]|uniref:Uncharacterized protein n=1 Tax=Coemansia guatemalensis TaxID=2761395 RepID=A0A9W8LVF8_9FUNG|nr:hypothetical protein H4R20_000882 [Coemansia guatemalensis]